VPSTGAVHCGSTVTTPEGTSQQSMPCPQHFVPQQNSADEQFPPLHGGSPHVPLLQYGCAPSHFLPHWPQLRMSFFS
jgi:hypothetical protein